MYRVIYRVLKVNTIPFCASTWALVTGTKCGQLLKTKVSRFCSQGRISRNDDFQIILSENFNGCNVYLQKNVDFEK